MRDASRPYHKYHPRFRLSQQALATELKVSRTPLREALARLAAEGLVVGEANRGMEVAPVHNDQAEQSYELRLLIEPQTIGAIVEDISEADIVGMQTILERMQRTADTHRVHDFQQAHLSFHQATCAITPTTFANSFSRCIRRFIGISGFTFRGPRFLNPSYRWTGAFCGALHARDAATARQNMEFHLTGAALGLVLDVDPDHKFDSLLIALRGLGIELEFGADGKIHRPTMIRRTRGDFHEMPYLRTNNLYYGPDSSDGVVARAVNSLSEGRVA